MFDRKSSINLREVVSPIRCLSVARAKSIRATRVKFASAGNSCYLGSRTKSIINGGEVNSLVAKLALENGSVFTGESFGASSEVTGEVVFNTSMTGYQEILTDPSYAGQIVTMT